MNTLRLPESKSVTHLSVFLIARRILATALGGIVFASMLYFAYLRTRADITSYFVFYPVDLMFPGYRKQIAIFRRTVPKGSAVIYLMDKFETWQSALWERSLYPDYDVKEVVGLNALNSPEIVEFRKVNRVEYVISAGNPTLDPGFTLKLVLPEYQPSIPVTIGKLPLP